MRGISLLAASVALVVAIVGPVEAGTTALAVKIDRPVGRGDQVIYYYDARHNFTTFLTVRNEGQSALVAEICLFSGTFTSVVRLTFPWPAGGLEIFDLDPEGRARPDAPANRTARVSADTGPR